MRSSRTREPDSRADCKGMRSKLVAERELFIETGLPAAASCLDERAVGLIAVVSAACIRKG